MKKEGGNDFPPFSFHLTHAFHLFADDGQCRRVRGEDGVQTLCLLGRVVGIVVAYLPLLVLRTGKTAPTPEVAAGKESALLGIVSHQREDIAVVAVASLQMARCLSIYSFVFSQARGRCSMSESGFAQPQL